MAEELLLGIDAGTSVIKAALFSREGAEVGAVRRPMQVRSPHPGWSEADMLEVWETTAHAIRELLARTKVTGQQILAVGLSGNMVGAWLLNAAGEPVRPAVLWNDGRAQPLLEACEAAQPGWHSQIFASSGSVLQPGCTLAVLRWLREHEPQTLGRSAYVLSCKDWLRFKLTGSVATDETEASVMPGDTRRRGYAEVLIDHFGLRAHRHLLPPVQPSHALGGELTREAARLTGLCAGTPVAIGAGDVPASALGAGAGEPGTALTVLGTTCLSSLVLETPTFEPADVGLLFPLPGGRWLRSYATIAGTTNLDWIARTILGMNDLTDATFLQLEALAQTSPVGAHGLIYLPYLSEVGIISPVVEPSARAEVFGLTPRHTRADLLRAVYEGVGFAIRDCYALAPPPKEVRLVGGGARSTFWCQLVADILGSQVSVPEGHEFGAKGAVLLAGVAVGAYASVARAVADTTRPAHTFSPREAFSDLYDETFEIYRSLRKALRPVWRVKGTAKRRLPRAF